MNTVLYITQGGYYLRLSQENAEIVNSFELPVNERLVSTLPANNASDELYVRTKSGLAKNVPLKSLALSTGAPKFARFIDIEPNDRIVETALVQGVEEVVE